jgi:hypothetical protein
MIVPVLVAIAMPLFCIAALLAWYVLAPTDFD